MSQKLTENCNKVQQLIPTDLLDNKVSLTNEQTKRLNSADSKDRTETDSTTTRQRQKATQSRQELGEEYFFSPSRRNRNSATALRTETFRYTETDTDRGYPVLRPLSVIITVSSDNIRSRVASTLQTASITDNNLTKDEKQAQRKTTKTLCRQRTSNCGHGQEGLPRQDEQITINRRTKYPTPSTKGK